MKRLIEHTTDAGTHLKLYVVFVPYINKWVVDCEVHRKEKTPVMKKCVACIQHAACLLQSVRMKQFCLVKTI